MSFSSSAVKVGSTSSRSAAAAATCGAAIEVPAEEEVGVGRRDHRRDDPLAGREQIDAVVAVVGEVGRLVAVRRRLRRRRCSARRCRTDTWVRRRCRGPSLPAAITNSVFWWSLISSSINGDSWSPPSERLTTGSACRPSRWRRRCRGRCPMPRRRARAARRCSRRAPRPRRRPVVVGRGDRARDVRPVAVAVDRRRLAGDEVALLDDCAGLMSSWLAMPVSITATVWPTPVIALVPRLDHVAVGVVEAAAVQLVVEEDLSDVLDAPLELEALGRP